MAGDKRLLRDSLIGEPLSQAALYRLMTWFSPAFPVGAFSYSCGIEWAVEAGDIRDAATLRRWLEAMLANGSGSCDGVFFSLAHQAASNDDDAGLRELAELAAVFTSSRERHLETTTQGRAFADAMTAAWPCETLSRFIAIWDGPVAYPIAAGLACAGHSIPRGPALHALLTALAANWVSAGVRLIPLGQTDSQRVLKALEPMIDKTALRASTATLDDLGSATFRVDLGSALHETQYTRLFRS